MRAAAPLLLLLAAAPVQPAGESAATEMAFHVGEAVGMAHRRVKRASELYAKPGEVVDVLALPDAVELSQSADPRMRYYEAVSASAVSELLCEATPYLTIGFAADPREPGGEPVDPESEAWLGVGTELHPVARMHYPADRAPPATSGRRLDTAATVLSPWREYLWVDPTFRRGSVFGNLSRAFSSAADGGGGDGPPRTRIEYHMLEDRLSVGTDWRDGQNWEGFYLFFNNCARELLITSLSDTDWFLPIPTLDWAKGIRTRHMHWIHGTTKIAPEHQYGATPLHRAAMAREPHLLWQTLANVPELDQKDLTSGGTALHSAGKADDPVAYEALLQAGFDPTIQNRDGKRPAELARSLMVRAKLQGLETRYGSAGEAPPVPPRATREQKTTKPKSAKAKKKAKRRSQKTGAN